LSYELLPWDSEFFGFPIGRIGNLDRPNSLPHSLGRADAEGIQCLYYLVPADRVSELHEALRHGFKPYDIRVELERSLDELTAPEPPAGVREAELADEPVVAALAAQTITATRFSLDDHFPRDRVPLLYAQWVRRGLRSGQARRVLIAEPAAGFLVCGLDERNTTGSIELIGVAPDFTRRGISRGLMHKAHAIMGEAGCDRARVVTQGCNVAAQRLYQSCGYRTLTVAWWLHRWRQG
jgi:dTDP-4-amino-4,6-dideoxy-D-galactose acyltransferase